MEGNKMEMARLMVCARPQRAEEDMKRREGEMQHRQLEEKF